MNFTIFPLQYLTNVVKRYLTAEEGTITAEYKWKWKKRITNEIWRKDA